MLRVGAQKEQWTRGRFFWASFPDAMPRSWRASMVAVFLAHIVLVVKSLWMHHEQINPDAVAYIRIAQYYLSGQTDLMISAYWGPLLSWLIIPWLLVFDDALLAAHAAMAVSAVVFLFGCFCVLRAVRLPGAAILIGTWITAFLSAAWSGVVITPDLLMAGLLCCGTSRLLSDKWLANARTAFGAGMVLGASYLAKAVALPMSALMVVGLAGTSVAVYQSSLRQTVRATTTVVAGFLIVAGPWIGVLSYKHGHPVFSTSALITHAVVGPPDMVREHPMVWSFHKPNPGRVTAWEDPTSLPYNYWSPFENVAYAVHQVKIIHRNAHTIVQHLKAFDWLGLGLVSAIFGYLLGTPWRKSLQEEPWRLSFIPVASLVVIYLPVYAEDVRFYWVALPFLIAAGFGFALYVSGAILRKHAVQRALALALVTLSFVIGNEAFFLQAFSLSASVNRYSHAVKILADKLKVTGLSGTVAAVGPVHGAGLYLAYFLNVPWFGHVDEVDDTEEILASGAALVIVPRGTAQAQQLREDQRFASADQPLFGCDEAPGNPFEIYLTRPLTASDTCPERGPRH